MSTATAFRVSEIELFSGRRFDLLNPVCFSGIEGDIAHSLAHLCRYTGHCSTFYSVAQHSVRVADRFNGNHRAALAGLLHDAHEAFVGDLSRPLKLALDALGVLPQFELMADRIQVAIELHFGLRLSVSNDSEIKAADTAELMYEAFHLMPSKGDGWAYPIDTCPQPLNALPPCEAEMVWMDRFNRYSR